MNLTHQKYLIIFNLFIINLLLSTTIVLYEYKWYAFIVFLCIPSIIYSISSVLLIFKAFCNKDTNMILKEKILVKNIYMLSHVIMNQKQNYCKHLFHYLNKKLVNLIKEL